MDFVLLWPAQSALPLRLATRMCGHATLALTKREVSPDPPQQASSPRAAHWLCSRLFLFLIHLISPLLCTSEFPVFAQAIQRGSVWGPL